MANFSVLGDRSQRILSDLYTLGDKSNEGDFEALAMGDFIQCNPIFPQLQPGPDR